MNNNKSELSGEKFYLTLNKDWFSPIDVLKELYIKYNKVIYQLEMELLKSNMKNTTNKTNTISRTTAVNLINTSKGRRFTVTFTKTDGTSRTMNGSRKNQTPLGNITMRVTNLGYRTVDPTRITELRINGTIYRVR